MTNRNVGARIAEIRRHRRLTQADLARLVHVTREQVIKYERGKTVIKADRLDALARALGCEAADLLASPGSPIPRRTSVSVADWSQVWRQTITRAVQDHRRLILRDGEAPYVDGYAA